MSKKILVIIGIAGIVVFVAVFAAIVIGNLVSQNVTQPLVDKTGEEKHKSSPRLLLCAEEELTFNGYKGYSFTEELTLEEVTSHNPKTMKGLPKQEPTALYRFTSTGKPDLIVVIWDLPEGMGYRIAEY